MKRLLGRDSVQDSKWRLALTAALVRLREVTGWAVCNLGTDGKVTVVRTQGKAPNAAFPGMPIPERMATASLNDAGMELECIRTAIDI